MAASLPALSRAAVAVNPRETVLREVPVPAIPPDGGLLKIVATGICGSDWPMYLSAAPGPRILGHEMVGTIAAVGEIAGARWGVKPGDYVALEEYLPCGHCEFCRTGEYRSCLETDTKLPGTIRYGSTPIARDPGLWGGYSQYLYLHPRTVFHRVPAHVPPHIAALALPIGNGFQWVCLDAQAGPGKSIVIQGPGQQGLGCVIAARAAGAGPIIVSGLARDGERFAVARALGADHTVSVDDEDLEAAVRRITGGRMADIVVESSAAGPAIINTSLRLLRKRGIFILASRKEAPVASFDADRLITQQIRALGTRGHSYQAVELALGVMADGRLPLQQLCTHTIGLADIDHGLRMVGGETAERSIHVTVDPWK